MDLVTILPTHFIPYVALSDQHTLHSLQLNGFSILSDTLHTDSTAKVLKASHQLSRLSRPCLTHSAIFAPKTGLHHI